MENKKVLLLDADSILYAISHKNKDSDDFKIYKDHADQWITNIITRCKATHYLGCLTLGSVFRHKLAVTKEYKSGRPKDKPKFFYELRKHLIDKWQFTWEDNLEAEDLISIYVGSIRAKEAPYIMAHIDHDLKTLPGEHYDFRTDKFYHVTPEEGDYYFWKSMITGCTTDSISGIPRLGEKKAEKILGNIDSSAFRVTVLDEYIKYYGEYQGIVKFTESYQLLKLLGSYNDLYPNPSGFEDFNPLIPVEFKKEEVNYNFNINDFI